MSNNRSRHTIRSTRSLRSLRGGSSENTDNYDAVEQEDEFYDEINDDNTKKEKELSTKEYINEKHKEQEKLQEQFDIAKKKGRDDEASRIKKQLDENKKKTKDVIKKSGIVSKLIQTLPKGLNWADADDDNEFNEEQYKKFYTDFRKGVDNIEKNLNKQDLTPTEFEEEFEEKVDNLRKNLGKKYEYTEKEIRDQVKKKRAIRKERKKTEKDQRVKASLRSNPYAALTQERPKIKSKSKSKSKSKRKINKQQSKSKSRRKISRPQSKSKTKSRRNIKSKTKTRSKPRSKTTNRKR